MLVMVMVMVVVVVMLVMVTTFAMIAQNPPVYPDCKCTKTLLHPA